MKKTMLRAVAGSSLCAVALVGTAGAASAGEITGNGRYKTVQGNSFCAYSGQNDGFHDPTHLEEGEDPGARVQSYGQIVKAGGKAFAPSPSIGCNPNRGFGE